MNYLYLDIETIPTQKSGAIEEIRSTISPPGNIKKSDSIEKWMEENADSMAEEKWLKTALNGSYGEIVSISYAINDDHVNDLYRYLDDSETELLANFYYIIRQELMIKNIDKFTRVIHGSKDLFDLRFLYQRSVILGEKPSFDLCQDKRANCEQVFDTMTAWSGWGNYCSLDSICNALGIKSPKGDMDGSKVWDAVRNGDVDKVAQYNKEDVEALRLVHKRLNFIK